MYGEASVECSVERATTRWSDKKEVTSGLARASSLNARSTRVPERLSKGASDDAADERNAMQRNATREEKAGALRARDGRGSGANAVCARLQAECAASGCRMGDGQWRARQW